MKKGDRVVSNEQFALQHRIAIKRNRGKPLTGQIVGHSRTRDVPKVKWDHLTSTFNIHKDFLRKEL